MNQVTSASLRYTLSVFNKNSTLKLSKGLRLVAGLGMQASSECANADCRATLQPPFRQCSRCQQVSYCSKECQIKAWKGKSGHKQTCTPRVPIRCQDLTAAMCAATLQTPPCSVEQHYIASKLQGLFEAASWPEVIALEEQALKVVLAVQSSWPEGCFGILSHLGRAFYQVGRIAKAIEMHTKHCAIAKDVGEKHSEGRARGSLGACFYSLGQYEQALCLNEQSHMLTGGDRIVCGNIGLCYTKLKQYTSAIEWHERSRAMAQDLGDKAEEGIASGNIARCYAALGQNEEAIELFRQSVKSAHESGDEQEQCKRSLELGKTLLDQVERQHEHCAAVDASRMSDANHWLSAALLLADKLCLTRYLSLHMRLPIEYSWSNDLPFSR